jgi:hypothetical protein
MVFNSTFHNISVISWQSVLLVKETGVTEENHRPVASHWQTFSHNAVSSTPRQLLTQQKYIPFLPQGSQNQAKCGEPYYLKSLGEKKKFLAIKDYELTLILN